MVFVLVSRVPISQLSILWDFVWITKFDVKFFRKFNFRKVVIGEFYQEKTIISRKNNNFYFTQYII